MLAMSLLQPLSIVKNLGDSVFFVVVLVFFCFVLVFCCFFFFFFKEASAL